MAPGARRVGAMLLEALAHGLRPRRVDLVLERRHVRRWWGRRRPDEVVENPLAADDRRGAAGVRRHEPHAAFAEDALPRFVGDCHAAELAAMDAGDAVVAGEPFVHER